MDETYDFSRYMVPPTPHSPKIFISVPMRGRTDEEIKKEIDKAREILIKKYPECEIVDNFIKKPEGNDEALYCLGEAIKKLGNCDAVYFCDGWVKARGCLVERSVALAYDIECLYYVDFE